MKLQGYERELWNPAWNSLSLPSRSDHAVQLLLETRHRLRSNCRQTRWCLHGNRAGLSCFGYEHEGLRRAFLDAISRKNVAVPLVKGKWPPPLLPKYAGVSSWSAFARGASTWNIQENEGLYQIVGHRLHQDGYWVEDHDQRIKCPAGTTVGDVIDRMIAILQEAAGQQSNSQ